MQASISSTCAGHVCDTSCVASDQESCPHGPYYGPVANKNCALLLLGT
jgi:hypothetical protein